MRAILILTSLWTGLALAGACDQQDPQMVGQKTEVTRFGEHCLGFDLGEATEKPYRVTALSVPYGVGQTLMPVGNNSKPVNTFDQQVTLKAGNVTSARMEYQAQEVAYLVIQHNISLDKGWLYRKDASGRETTIHEKVNGMKYNNYLWGALWTLTFGTISLFWLPTNSSTLTYTEAVPLNSGIITFTHGGGGGCFAFDDVNNSFMVDTARLRVGRAYVFEIKTDCFTGAGNTSNAYMKIPSLWIKYVREGVTKSWESQIPLQAARRFQAWERVTEQLDFQHSDMFYKFLPHYLVGHNAVVPQPLDLPMLDRGWETRREVIDGNTTDLLIAPMNPPTYTFCTGGFDVEWQCMGTSTYTRIAANPPGPVSLSAYNDLPYRGLPVDSVTTVNMAGPNGEQLQQLQVNYRDEDAGFVTIHDRFSCYGHCPP